MISAEWAEKASQDWPESEETVLRLVVSLAAVSVKNFLVAGLRLKYRKTSRMDVIPVISIPDINLVMSP